MKTTKDPLHDERGIEGDPSVTSDTEILEEAVERFKQAMDFESENRNLAEDDVDFRHGDQWPDEIRVQRQQDSRPCLTFNKMEERVDQVVGDQRQAKAAISIHPADIVADKHVQNREGTKDYALSQVMNGLIRTIEQNSDAQIAYNTAFDHSCGHGFGYWRIITAWDVSDPFSQVIRIRRVKNSFSVYLDPLAQEPHGGDANWGFVTSLVDRDTFKRLYPKARSDSWSQSGQGDEYEYWYQQDNIRVAEYFRRVPTDKIAAQLNSGAVMYVDDAEMLETLRDEISGNGGKIVRTKEVKVPKVEWYKLTAGDVLETPREFPSFYVPIVRCVGKELNVRGYDYLRGIVRHAKDAQRMYNYNRTAQIEQVALQPKVPFLATPEQIDSFQQSWNRVNKDNLPYLLYNHVEGVPMPRREPPPLPAQGNMLNAQADDADIDSTTGMHKASLGAPSNEKSGKAIRERKMEGDVATFTFHDNFHMALKQTGRILVDMIPRVYDTARIERILTLEDEEDYVQLNQKVVGSDGKVTYINDLGAGKYDVRVSTGPSYTTMREEARESMLDFAQALPQTGALIADMIAENMDWPKADAVAERIKKTLPPGIADDKDNQEKEITEQDVQMAIEQAVQQAMEQSGQMIEQMKVQIDGMEAQSKAETDEYNAITKRMEAMQGVVDDEERVKDLVAKAYAEILSETMQ